MRISTEADLKIVAEASKQADPDLGMEDRTFLYLICTTRTTVFEDINT